MSLHHPALSYNGKKKGKQKFASAEAKQKHLQLEQEWAMLKKQHGVEIEDKKRARAMAAAPLEYKLETPVGRTNTHHIKSLDTGIGNATLAAPKVYTGTKMIGIGQLHKSNAVPVFSQDDAIDISKMRR